MTLDKFFREGVRINPAVGKFVVGGGLVLAVAAMALAWLRDDWGADRGSVLIAVGGLPAVSLLVAVLAGCCANWRAKRGRRRPSRHRPSRPLEPTIPAGPRLRRRPPARSPPVGRSRDRPTW